MKAHPPKPSVKALVWFCCKGHIVGCSVNYNIDGIPFLSILFHDRFISFYPSGLSSVSMLTNNRITSGSSERLPGKATPDDIPVEVITQLLGILFIILSDS